MARFRGVPGGPRSSPWPRTKIRWRHGCFENQYVCCSNLSMAWRLFWALLLVLFKSVGLPAVSSFLLLVSSAAAFLQLLFLCGSAVFLPFSATAPLGVLLHSHTCNLVSQWPWNSWARIRKLKWATKSVSFSCQDTPKFPKSASFPSALRQLSVSSPSAFRQLFVLPVFAYPFRGHWVSIICGPSLRHCVAICLFVNVHIMGIWQ